jgi:hypothetical protein
MANSRPICRDFYSEGVSEADGAAIGPDFVDQEEDAVSWLVVGENREVAGALVGEGGDHNEFGDDWNVADVIPGAFNDDGLKCCRGCRFQILWFSRLLDWSDSSELGNIWRWFREYRSQRQRGKHFINSQQLIPFRCPLSSSDRADLQNIGTPTGCKVSHRNILGLA